jgi:tRNA (guanine-N7-)-methyltransferase
MHPATMNEPGFIFHPDSLTRTLDLERVFGRRAPLEVDLGCGKGRFLLARARRQPATNLLGVERQPVRLRKIDRRLAAAGLTNVRLLHLEAAYSLRFLLPPGCAQAIHIFFPDPWPKRRHHPRRLLSSELAADLVRALAPGGRINLATDHLDYFKLARSHLASRPELSATDPYVPDEEEQTDFERIFLSKGDPIGRCSFVRLGGDAAEARPAGPSAPHVADQAGNQAAEGG